MYGINTLKGGDAMVRARKVGTYLYLLADLEGNELLNSTTEVKSLSSPKEGMWGFTFLFVEIKDILNKEDKLKVDEKENF